MDRVRGAPNDPQTRGKIKRWHQTLKNRILLENYFLQGELKSAIAAFVEYDNNHRFHESLGNLTPADFYFWRGQAILAERKTIKAQTVTPSGLCGRAGREGFQQGAGINYFADLSQGWAGHECTFVALDFYKLDMCEGLKRRTHTHLRAWM